MRQSDRSRRLDISCGAEKALFDVTLYGPGGGSRCIQFGEHLITPIEFEALAGRKARNWKINIKFEGKPIKSLFEAGTLKSCDKSCACVNCNIGRKYPTDLELLIEKVYLNKTYDLSIVKKEKTEDVKKSPRKMLENKEDQISDVKDEFFSSPEATPVKNQEKTVDDLTKPIHIETSQHTPDKHQKDIRTFFTNRSSPRSSSRVSATVVSGPKSPSAMSDSSVELISEGRPKRRVLEVDLTDASDKNKIDDDKPKRKPGRPPKTDTKSDNEELLKILQEEKRKALTPRKKLPRDAKTEKETVKVKEEVKPKGKRKMSP